MTDIDSVINIRYMVDDVVAAVTGTGVEQIVRDDSSGHPIELFTPVAR